MTEYVKDVPGDQPVITVFQIQITGACDVSRESLSHILSGGPGRAAVLAVGGARESLEASPGNLRLHLEARKGFCRLALKHGASLVPVYSFGESDLFDQVANPKGSRLRRFQDWFKSWTGFAPPIICGRGLFNYLYGYLPFRRPINTVVGAPLAVPRDANPSRESVEALHGAYKAALVALFEEHKATYGHKAEDHLSFV